MVGQHFFQSTLPARSIVWKSIMLGAPAIWFKGIVSCIQALYRKMNYQSSMYHIYLSPPPFSSSWRKSWNHLELEPYTRLNFVRAPTTSFLSESSLTTPMSSIHNTTSEVLYNWILSFSPLVLLGPSLLEFNWKDQELIALEEQEKLLEFSDVN